MIFKQKLVVAFDSPNEEINHVKKTLNHISKLRSHLINDKVDVGVYEL